MQAKIFTEIFFLLNAMKIVAETKQRVTEEEKFFAEEKQKRNEEHRKFRNGAKNEERDRE